MRCLCTATHPATVDHQAPSSCPASVITLALIRGRCAGVPEDRIKRMGAADNFWSSGATGPCGPCSELYYDLHPERGSSGIDLDDGGRFIEFYNLVFMELNRGADGETAPLAAKNIDTGLGLERMAQILQGVPNNYETDLMKPIMDEAASVAGVLLLSCCPAGRRTAYLHA